MAKIRRRKSRRGAANRPAVKLPDQLLRLAAEISAARHTLKLTQRQLAPKLGIAHTTLENIEAARNWPSVPVLIALRRTLADNDCSLLT